MIKAMFLFLSLQILALSLAFASPELYVGKLRATSKSFLLEEGAKTLRLDFSGPAKNGVPSLLGKAPFVEIFDGVIENDVVHSTQVPTIISGDRILEGRLTRRGLQGQESYSIDGVAIQFGRTKKVNGTEFDAKSRDYFVNKRVRAIGTLKNGTFILQSVLRAEIFSAETTPLIDSGLPRGFIETFDKDPTTFVLQMVSGRIQSPSPLWFRKTLFSNQASAVHPGDPVLLLSASGGQLDDNGAVNGHLAAGFGRVGEDLQIRGEMFNVYVTNEKEIVPGNVELVDYFGHLISGQQNYRPTYTLALYGLPESSLLKLKAELDRFHPLFREGHTKITPNKNCVTLTSQALADIHIYGSHRNGSNGIGAFKLLSTQTGFPPELNFAQELGYLAQTKRPEFMPGPAFQSIVKNLKYLNETEGLGITRADFIFGGQTPSARNVGRAPTKGVVQQFAVQGGVFLHNAKDRVMNKRH